MAKPICASHNVAVRDFLATHRQIKVVVLAAFWSTYFRLDSQVRPASIPEQDPSPQATKVALKSTLAWLRDSQHEVVLLGPVPVYEKSVPLALALEVATRHSLLHTTTAVDQKALHAPFFQVVESFQPAPWLHLGDPITWMCNGDCVTTEAGVPLYRDSNHLSVAGANEMSKNIGELIAAATKGARQRDDDRAPAWVR